MTLKIAGIEEESFVDGDGCRLAVFVQGCPHHCRGCHNPETHDFHAGKTIDTEQILKMLLENPLLSGITFSGGEPFCQPEPLCSLAKKAHAKGFNVWCYSGYTLEELEQMNHPQAAALLREIDILVDGKYIEGQRDLTLRFRGSKNQRIIDMNATRRLGSIQCLT